MSSIYNGIFGGKKESSTNQAFPALSQALTPALGYTAQAGGALNTLLNPNDPTAGYADYKKNSGFDFQNQQGMQNVAGSGAAQGLLRSGATSGALVNLGNNLASSNYKDYLGDLFKFGNLGLGAAGALGSAGATSQSSGKNGITSFIGQLMGKGASG